MIGILGGTFDPPHWGHVQLAKNFIEILELEELIWLPAGQPWQKSTHITPASIRYDLTKAAAQDLQNEIDHAKSPVKIQVSRIELDRQGPSYTIDTARELRSMYGPNKSIVWLMGADTYQNLPSWNDWQNLPEYLHLAVASRRISPRAEQATIPAHYPQTIQEIIRIFDSRITQAAHDLKISPSGKIFFDELFHVDLSSTELREMLHDALLTSKLKQAISPKVLELIYSLGIYQANPPNESTN